MTAEDGVKTEQPGCGIETSRGKIEMEQNVSPGGRSSDANDYFPRITLIERFKNKAMAGWFYLLKCRSIVMYCLVSISMVLINKQAYAKGLDPICGYLAQQVVGTSMVASIVLMRFGAKKYPDSVLSNLRDTFEKNPLMPVPQTIILTDSLLVGLSGLTLFCYVCLSNYALNNSTVSGYLIARSFTIPLSTSLMFFVPSMGGRPTWKQVLACIGIMSGSVIGGLDGSNVPPSSLILGFCSCVFQVANVFLTKWVQHKIMGDRRGTMATYSIMWNCILSTTALTISQQTESGSFFSVIPEGFLANISKGECWTLASCCCGVALNLATMDLLSEHSPMVFEVVSFSKSALTNAIGVIFLGDPSTVRIHLATVAILASSLGYSRVSK